MAAYLIGNYDVTNPEGFSPYGPAVGPTIQAHGGKILVAGPGSKAIEGSPRQFSVIVEFPSMDALQGWYDSPEYQAILPLRLDNTEGQMVVAEQFAMPG